MLHSKFQSYLSFSTLLLLLSFFFLSTLLVAQGQRSVKVDIPQNSIDNFILGIKSDNTGAKKNHIYFAGKYCLKQTRSALVEEFLKTSDEDLQAMIVWSLFRICDKKCISDLDKISQNLNSEKLKTLITYLKSIKKYDIAISNAS